MTPPDIKRQRIRVSFHPILCCHSFFFFHFLSNLCLVFSWAQRNLKVMRGPLPDRTQGQCGDQTKLHQVFPPRLCLSSFFFFFFPFNQSSCSPDAALSLGQVSNAFHWCQCGGNHKVYPQMPARTGVSLGHCILHSTPLRHVRLFLQSERENNL